MQSWSAKKGRERTSSVCPLTSWKIQWWSLCQYSAAYRSNSLSCLPLSYNVGQPRSTPRHVYPDTTTSIHFNLTGTLTVRCLLWWLTRPERARRLRWRKSTIPQKNYKSTSKGPPTEKENSHGFQRWGAVPIHVHQWALHEKFEGLSHCRRA